MTQILAIIPARGGSKRLPGKNIKDLVGKPMISYTIETAKHCSYIDRVVVSTDYEEISAVAKNSGAEVIMRPAELATDTASTNDAINHVLQTLSEQSYEPEHIVILQPTSPLRNLEDLTGSIKLYLEKKPTTLVSVCEFEHPVDWAMTMTHDARVKFSNEASLAKRSQDQTIFFRPNGAVYLIGRDRFLVKPKFYTDNTIGYVMPKQRSVDIDDIYDFLIAEAMLKHGEL
ncbi:TPA: hypothetical protein DF272_03255 [Candidatus Falkowbacteria bacterium]|nr:hypothetical protein [Candidatus Falkowbacteria bacterium]